MKLDRITNKCQVKRVTFQNQVDSQCDITKIESSIPWWLIFDRAIVKLQNAEDMKKLNKLVTFQATANAI